MSRRRQILEALGIGAQWRLREQKPHDQEPHEQLAYEQQPNKQQPNDQKRQLPPDSPTTYDAAAVLPIAVTQSTNANAFAENGMHSDDAIAEMDWETLQAAVANCRRCELCQTRTRTVFGAGDAKAQWLFVGEGPGRNEDRQGEPFVGPAGKLLDSMLVAIALRRGRNAFIANVVKCRPTDGNGKDRAPSKQEASACKPYLLRQIALIQPSMMVALGKTAAVGLLECDPAIAVSKLRGVVHRYGELPLVVTYHPAYLLRVLVDKRKAWEDLCLAMTTYSGAAELTDSGQVTSIE